MGVSPTPPGTVHEVDPRWTARRRRAMAVYVGECAAILRLADWDIRLDFDNCAGDEVDATMVRTWGQKRAVMRFGSPFLDLSEEEQRHTVAHELTHCHLFNLHDAVEHALDPVPEQMRGFAREVVNREVELATDALADVLWRQMPVVRLDESAAGTSATARAARVAAKARSPRSASALPTISPAAVSRGPGTGRSTSTRTDTATPPASATTAKTAGPDTPTSGASAGGGRRAPGRRAARSSIPRF